MRVPMNWLRELIALPEGTTTVDVARTLTEHTAAVERIERVGGEVSGPVVVGQVLSMVPESHKNGKTVNWCRVDVGPALNAQGHPKNVEEGVEGRGIVCGAHNFQVGDFVVVSLPGSVLPGGFEISARRTYGHMSDGMICAVDELGIGEDHTGILVLPSSVDGHALVPGEDARTILDIPEDVLEVDVTPDIGYCMSMRGIAREVSGVLGGAFSDIYGGVGATGTEDCVDGPVTVEGSVPVRLESEACSRFVALPLEGFDATAPTPRFIQDRLFRAGMRPISLAVDVTNYVMLESGQPLHAYDADKVTGSIVVRKAGQGEKLRTLDDVERTLDPDDLVIADDSGAIGLAGVMGGATTEMSAESSSIILEGAHFDAMTVARTYRRHKLGSEASRRFERGVDPAATLPAVNRAAELLVRYGGATVGAATAVGTIAAMPRQSINADLPSRVLGQNIGKDEVIDILTRSGVTVTAMGDSLSLVPPTWRPDLVDPFDYVEEVARKRGFDAVESVLPRTAGGGGLTKAQQARRRVNAAVAGAGFVEVISLPFMGDADLDHLGLDAEDPRRATVKLANPLDDTHPYLRTTLLPGLIEAAGRNISRSQDDLAIFETGTVFRATSKAAAPRPAVDHRPSDAELAEIAAALPAQPRMLAGLLTGHWLPDRWDGTAVKVNWTHAVLLAEEACHAVGLELQRRAAALMPWHPGRCAELVAAGQVIGHAGELHPTVCRKAGLPARSCAVELDLDALIAAAPDDGTIRGLSTYPVAKEDVALVVDEEVSAAQVHEALVAGGGELLESVELFDVYAGEQVGEHKKSLAFSLRLRAADRTLTDAEAAEARDAAVARAEQVCGAQLRAQ